MLKGVVASRDNQLKNAIIKYNDVSKDSQAAKDKLADVQANLQAKLDEEASKNASFVGRLTQLSTALDLLEKKLQANIVERDVLRKEKASLQARLEETDDAARSFKSKLDEETAQKERLEKLARFRTQQIMDLQNEIEELKSKIREGFAVSNLRWQRFSRHRLLLHKKLPVLLPQLPTDLQASTLVQLAESQGYETQSLPRRSLCFTPQNRHG